MESVMKILFLLFTLSSFTLSAQEQSSKEQSTNEQVTEVQSTEIPSTEEPLTEEQIAAAEQAAYMEWAQGIWDSLTPRTGGISLGDGLASLNVPPSFYYLSPDDAEKVLVEAWGNPTGMGANSLGMLFPEELTPFDSASWAVTIDYEEEGYISDEDADDLDYDDLLKEMQADFHADNKERIAQGYESIDLIGWASPPYYDKANHKMYWAKELKFGEQEINTLNYNIRILGRKGVLVLNFIADMEQKEVINNNLQTVLTMTNFSQGSRYEDFNPDIDKIAAYGLGGLVAGKVLMKAGFIAVAIAFLKKFGVFVVVGIGAMLASLFKRKKPQA